MSDQGLGDVWTLIIPNFAAIGGGGVDMITPLLVIIIWAVGLCAIGYTIRQWWRGRRYVKESISLIEGLDNETFWERRSAVAAAAASVSEPVRDAWREFDETLVVEGRRVYNTVNAEEFFNDHRFVPQLVSNRLLHAVPTISTTLGLLGTFAGLTLGLGSLDLGSTSDQLRTGIQALVDGASLGFTASLWGVFTSLVVNTTERSLERSVVSRIRRLQDRIDSLFTMRSPEQSLSDIASSTGESSQALQVLHEKIGSALQESVAHVGENTSRAVTEAIHGSLAPIMADLASRAANQSADVFNEISERLTESFTGIGVSLAEQLKESAEQMRTTLDYMGDQLAQQADRHLTQMDAMQEAAARQLSELSQATERQMRLLDESLPGVVAGLDRAASLVGEATGGMDEVVAGLTSITSQLTETSAELTRMLSDAVEKMDTLASRTSTAADAFAAQQTSVAELTQRAVDAAALLQATLAQFGHGFDGMKEAQDRFLGGLEQRLQTHSQAMAGWLASYADEVGKQTSHRMGEWNAQTERFTSTMLSATQALSDVIDELSDRAEGGEAVA